jgi:trehalose 2-sulfotransferase
LQRNDGTSGGERRPAASYVICATPRSGSTLLCEVFKDTGVAGFPAEHFELLLETGLPRQPRDYFQRSNDPEVWALLDDPELYEVLGERGGWYEEFVSSGEEDEGPLQGPPDFDLLLQRGFEAGTTPNGVFGTKIMWAYFRDFVRLARRSSRGAGLRPCGVAEALFPEFRGYVWIRREDTVRQAVSLWKALQNWNWRQDDEGVGAGKSPPRYSFAAIDHLRLRIEEHNASWGNFFESCGVTPVEIVYERFVEDYEAMVRRTLGSLGISLPEGYSASTPAMRRQSDRLSEEWVSRYREEVSSRAARATRAPQ